MSLKNISKSNPDLLKGKVVIEQGDGREGWVKDKSLLFDVIHVGAAA
jgi:protein-L-isoaspartate O-methyltransferase